MTHTKANPASTGMLGGAGNALAGKRCNLSLNLAPTKAKSFVDADGFQHCYGPDRPDGRGWWSPIDEGPEHFVRARRRGRS